MLKERKIKLLEEINNIIKAIVITVFLMIISLIIILIEVLAIS